ncbi:hypothetical protein [Texcoconibacillus texcoconensis]|uniref:Uncharacterized protein YacL n=1 Tax=Texcoconibacillus texcoconensis TaxID=1095777 RepID=A0A840QHB9_9BACI|nr:hypothetical protein [Texcoconibacillus texcoconensis]MBB5172052.1 uncharacterized protein YacL [Texcoconibacillus texcoconensis]
MLHGTWRINIVFALIGFMIVFIASMMINYFPISLFRGVIAFFIAYVLGYFIRFLWALTFAHVKRYSGDHTNVSSKKEKTNEQSDNKEHSQKQATKNDDKQENNIESKLAVSSEE